MELYIDHSIGVLNIRLSHATCIVRGKKSSDTIYYMTHELTGKSCKDAQVICNFFCWLKVRAVVANNLEDPKTYLRQMLVMDEVEEQLEDIKIDIKYVKDDQSIRAIEDACILKWAGSEAY